MRILIATLALAAALPAVAAPPVTQLTTLHSFSNSDGYIPSGSLVEGEDGVFYGVTANGGTHGAGTLFRITSAGALTTLVHFESGGLAPGGNQPAGGLVRGADGALYGVTMLGGVTTSGIGGAGVIFRVTTAGAFSVLHTFDFDDGAYPGELMLASDGNFYGTTADAGALGGGTIYRMTPAGVVTTLHDFAGDATEVGTGLSRLVEGPGMVLYGTSRTGGYTVPGIEGTFFALEPNGTFSVRHRFDFAVDSGSRPTGIALGNDGNLYGTTFVGTGFRMTPSGDHMLLHQVLGCSCGLPLSGAPSGALLLRDDGMFYGVTSGGGVHNEGTIYQMSHAGALEPVHSFNGEDEGMHPAHTLTAGRDGRLYGTTTGFNTAGTVFKLTFLPPAPTNLVAARANAGEIALTWSAARSANTYNVYRGTASGTLDATPVLTGVTATNATVTGLTNGTNYFFTVAAVNEAGVGAQSTEASGMPVAAPTNLAATHANGTITLTWTAAPGAASHVMFQGTTSTFGATPTQTGINTNTLQVTGVTALTTYYFKVAGVYAGANGPDSNVVSLTVPAPPPPATPPATSPPAGGGGGGSLDAWLLAALLVLAVARAPAMAASRSRRRRAK